MKHIVIILSIFLLTGCFDGYDPNTPTGLAKYAPERAAPLTDEEMADRASAPQRKLEACIEQRESGDTVVDESCYESSAYLQYIQDNRGDNAFNPNDWK